MEKEEILKQAQKKKEIVGEMEKAKINKSCWIGNISACFVAVVFMIVEGGTWAFLCNICTGSGLLCLGECILFLSILHCKTTLWGAYWSGS